MKHTSILPLILMFIMSMFAGCDTDFDVSEGPVTITSGWYGGSIYTNYCEQKHKFYITAEKSGGFLQDYYYFWIGIADTSKNNGALLGYGDPETKLVPCDDAQLGIVIDYTFKLAPNIQQDYQFYIFACEKPYMAGFPELASYFYGPINASVNFLINSDSCAINCCTQRQGVNRYRAFGIREMYNLTGVSAYIKPRYGKLCHENDPTKKTASFAWIGIQDDITMGSGIYAIQMGIKIRRHEPFSWDFITDTVVYAEIWSGGVLRHTEIFDTLDPVDGQEVYFKIDFDPETPLVKFYYESNLKPIFVYDLNAEFQNHEFPIAMYQCEVVHYENDMFGTELYPCEINGCSYYVNGNEYNTVFGSHSTDIVGVTPYIYGQPDEWHIDHDDNNLEIYDINPQQTNK